MDVAPWIANWIRMVSNGIRWYCMVFDGVLLLNSIQWYYRKSQKVSALEGPNIDICHSEGHMAPPVLNRVKTKKSIDG